MKFDSFEIRRFDNGFTLIADDYEGGYQRKYVCTLREELIRLLDEMIKKGEQHGKI